ncbi:permease [Lyngbya confervoides]|uniref:Permease n=1 Tax=Lyngbya confervoides BDU141951 TaxID=1574623 RepID=A0ABD4T1W7_9CYAN|nr:permease [Lyngbya confervoides]MCM1982668.1 permease [Lyngbya confervoides BDU141951]
METFRSSLTLFLGLLVEAIPFLILGVLVSGLLLFFVDEQKLINLLPQHPFLGALAGSLIGFLFPVCECGNVPVARRLLSKGVSTPVAIGFLLAAPTINPVVVWATWTAFRDQPEIVVLRMVFSLVIATLIGWIFSVQSDLKPFLQPAIAMMVPEARSTSDQAVERPTLLQSGSFLLDQPGKPVRLDANNFQSVLNPPQSKPQGVMNRLQLLLDNTLQELRELGGVLVLGSLIATVIQVAVPREIILGLGQGPISSVVAMMTLGGVISICSTVDSFFALSFASTFTTGAILAFLVFGPMFDLKSMGLMLTVFKARAVAYIFGLVMLLTLFFTLVINLWVS